jgi:hypothetical protein
LWSILRYCRTPSHPFHRTLGPLLALALCAGCGRQENQNPPVARVGEAALTTADLATVQDSLWHSPRAVREYVATWISSELLYQEAARRGLADNVELQRQLEILRRRMAVQALLDQVFTASDTTSVSDDAIAAVYASQGTAFLLKEDVANVSFALFADRDPANTFRSRILRGSSWQEAVTITQQDSLTRSQLLQVATRQYFTRTNLYPEELWKLARTLFRDEVSFVVKTEAGYYVLAVHSLKQQGELPDLDYIKNDIRDRLLLEQRRLSYERLLASLRSTTPVEMHLELLDSTAAPPGADGD